MANVKQGRKGRTKRGMGRLYIRSKDKRDFPAGTPGVYGGLYWIEYQKPTGILDSFTGKPVKKKKREKLLDEEGKPITTLKQAQVAQEKLMSQYVTGDRIGLLRVELERAEGKHHTALEDANPPLTIEDAWDCFKDHPKLDCGSTSLYNYHCHWTRFLKWLASHDPEFVYMRDIDMKAAFEYARWLGGKVAPSTYNKHINFLKLIYKVLKVEIRAEASPLAEIETKKLSKAKSKARVRNHTRRDLSMEELALVIDSAEGDLQTLLMLGAATGLRLGDCCTILWNECLLDQAMIKRVPNKTQSGEIKIGIPPRLVNRLLMTPKTERKGYVLPKYAADYTYVSEKGKNTHCTRITNRIQKHFVSCGIQIHAEGTGFRVEPDPENKEGYIKIPTGKRAVVVIGFHSLRHTFVSMQAAKGTPQAIVQKIVGHGSPAMTMHYTHVSDDTAKKATLYIGDDVKSADFEVLAEPVPGLLTSKTEPFTPAERAIDVLSGISAGNWRQCADEVLEILGAPSK